MARATTVRFSDEVYARLDQASARTGLPVNSIVVAACLEWMQRHSPDMVGAQLGVGIPMPAAPRWATLRRAVVQAVGKQTPAHMYPFERFTQTAKNLLTAAQIDAISGGSTYIGTEHLLLAAFSDGGSQAAQLLSRLKITEPAARTEIELALNKKVPLRRHRIVPTARVKRVIEIAFELCGSAQDPLVTSGHILLAVATEGEGVAAHVLSDLGATPERIKEEMDALTEPEA